MIKRSSGLIFVLALVGANVFFPSQFDYLYGLLSSDKVEHASPDVSASYDFSALERAITEQRSKVWLDELPYRVKVLLPDDNKGSRHQRFIVTPEGFPDLTLLIAHNIDLAEKAPVEVGDQVLIRGRYEWNEKGGVIHWTHHDPKGQKEGGWLKLGNNLYR